MFAHLAHRNIIGMLLGTTIALLLISFLMALALRSIRYGLLSLLPNLAPAAIGFGLWALWVTTLVLFVGFMCLAQSDFAINGNMGLLTAVIILVAVV